MSDQAPPPFRFSREARQLGRSMMRDLIAITARPGIISFAGGLPAPELFPVEAWRACTDHVLARDGRRALQYGPPYAPLQEAIARLMGGRGARVDPDQVFPVTGAQQGLHVAGRLLMDADSAAAVDEYVFPGVRQAFGGFRRELREVACDPEGGPDPEVWARVVAARPRPRAAVVVPEHHNPLGTSLGAGARRAMLAAAAAAGVPIVEDDPYGWLRFDGEARPPLLAEAPGQVLYIGSFSKLVAPALRLGWMAAPAPLVSRLRVIKESVDLECSQLTQRVLAAFLEAGHLDSHLAAVRAAYRARRDAMVAGLRAHFPDGSRWSQPEGGMFVWVELPAGYDSLALLPRAVEAGVAYVPGGAFASGAAPRTMRLNFSNADGRTIGAGLELLGRVLGDAADAGRSPPRQVSEGVGA